LTSDVDEIAVCFVMRTIAGRESKAAHGEMRGITDDEHVGFIRQATEGRIGDSFECDPTMP